MLNTIVSKTATVILLLALSGFLSGLSALAYTQAEKEIRASIKKGEEAFDQNDFIQSEEDFSSAFRDSRQHSLIGFEIAAHERLIQTYVAEKKFSEAESLSKSELEFVKKSAPHFLMKQLCSYASVLTRARKFPDAEAIYMKAKKLSDDQDCDYSDKALVLLGLGNLRYKLADFQGAQDYFAKALELINNYSYEGYEQRSAANCMAAFCNAEVGDDGKAEELYKDNISLHDKYQRSDSVGFARGLSDYGEFLVARNRLAEAEALFKQAYEVFQKYGIKDKSAKECPSGSIVLKGNRRHDFITAS